MAIAAAAAATTRVPADALGSPTRTQQCPALYIFPRPLLLPLLTHHQNQPKRQWQWRRHREGGVTSPDVGSRRWCGSQKGVAGSSHSDGAVFEGGDGGKGRMSREKSERTRIRSRWRSEPGEGWEGSRTEGRTSRKKGEKVREKKKV